MIGTVRWYLASKCAYILLYLSLLKYMVAIGIAIPATLILQDFLASINGYKILHHRYVPHRVTDIVQLYRETSYLYKIIFSW